MVGDRVEHQHERVIVTRLGGCSRSDISVPERALDALSGPSGGGPGLACRVRGPASGTSWDGFLRLRQNLDFGDTYQVEFADKADRAANLALHLDAAVQLADRHLYGPAFAVGDIRPAGALRSWVHGVAQRSTSAGCHFAMPCSRPEQAQRDDGDAVPAAIRGRPRRQDGAVEQVVA